MKVKAYLYTIIGLMVCAGLSCPVLAAETSQYMGGDVNLTKAPNGAIARQEVLETAAKIMYTKPTTEKLADGVWCIGGYSLANTTVIEAEDGLIVYDTGDTKEEAQHISDAIKKISKKPVKVIIYSNSHYALSAGALVDSPDGVLMIGHPEIRTPSRAAMAN